ncbi:MAG: hypothetical protein B7Y07_06600 [Halothiobacillus sp. 24-54-40]|nr:MAG: hypothetical protein B7Y58_05965 [Halothiobacillus sp. 35-54-62]OYZ86889.1 MAG: hypothetical protein B7Y07_06600 [Halothiobacillus sp. 24-54-40]OZA81043.1 MAG: hypothetical protein B7X64_03595 [Halothiobacillus sp. 39-53-45]
MCRASAALVKLSKRATVLNTLRRRSAIRKSPYSLSIQIVYQAYLSFATNPAQIDKPSTAVGLSKQLKNWHKSLCLSSQISQGQEIMQSLRKIALLSLIGAGCVLASTASHAEDATRIYKWVDKKGETHFSQIPPTQGEAQQINPDFATPGAPAPKAPEGESQDAAPDHPNEPLAPNAPITVVNKKEAEKACQAAQEQIKTLQNSQNQLMTQEADGKYRALTPQEIAGRVKQAQEVADKACVK